MSSRTTKIGVGLLALLLLAPLVYAVPEGPEYGSPEWDARERANYQRANGAQPEHLNPAFARRNAEQSVLNSVEYYTRTVEDPSWVLPPAYGGLPVFPIAAAWSGPATGDPFRYPTVEGSDGRPFYEAEAQVIPVVFYDRDCARMSARVWAPRGASAELPGVVIGAGSFLASEALYWWGAQAMVRAGYVVLTYELRGQGRSDWRSPSGQQGVHSDFALHHRGMVDAIDFFRSTPARPYPHDAACAGTYPTPTAGWNPHFAIVDPDRLGAVGHAISAAAVRIVQSYGAEGAEPWPGLLNESNPVDVTVGWDAVSLSESGVVPRVPAMSLPSEYGLTPMPFRAAPDPEGRKAVYRKWTLANVPAFQLTIQGSTHYEWTTVPEFPATSWCPAPETNRCAGGWGRDLAEHYTIAWLDRWLKYPGEPGADDADARLLADADWRERMSFYFRSARDFPSRDGAPNLCDDIRAGCEATP